MSAAPARARAVEPSRPVKPVPQAGIVAPALEILAGTATGFATIRFVLRMMGS